jgi:uncharacterized repeat protein (TIGR04138 family)
MESKTDLFEVVDGLVQKYGKYKPQAYFFVSAALSYTLKKFDKPRHISGVELLDGIRELALRQFGPMTRTVFENWGVTKTLDFGEMVFQLVEAGLMGKTDEDKLDDFRDIYDFRKVFDDRLQVDIDKESLSRL